MREARGAQRGRGGHARARESISPTAFEVFGVGVSAGGGRRAGGAGDGRSGRAERAGGASGQSAWVSPEPRGRWAEVGEAGARRSVVGEGGGRRWRRRRERRWLGPRRRRRRRCRWRGRGGGSRSGRGPHRLLEAGRMRAHCLSASHAPRVCCFRRHPGAQRTALGAQSSPCKTAPSYISVRRRRRGQSVGRVWASARWATRATSVPALDDEDVDRPRSRVEGTLRAHRERHALRPVVVARSF